MNSFVITTDSGADLPLSYCQTHEIEVLPLAYTMDGTTYLGTDGLSNTEFYEKLRAGSMPTTSAANPSDTADLFRRVLSQGNDLLHIAFSSGLSSTCEAAQTAAAIVSEEFPDRKIFVVDSLCASLGQAFLLHQAVKLRAAGTSIEETAQRITDMRLNVVHNFTVDDLGHLHRGGRVSKATAIVGSLVGIKPVLHVDDLGHLVALSKVRGRKASIHALITRMEKQIEGFDNQEVFICHGDCAADAEYLAQLVRERFGIQEIMVEYIGPVIGTHSGPGTLAVFFFGNPR